MARLQIAVDVALDLARSLDVREVVRRLVRRAAEATRAERCSLLRIEGGVNGDAITVDAYDASGRESALGYRRPVAGQWFLREAVASARPTLHGGAPPQVLAAMPELLRQSLADVRYTATMPLLYGGEVIALLVLSRRREQPFGKEDIDTLRLLGGPAGLALRNSFLYSRTEEASRVKTDFLDMAAHELRTPLTVISGYLSILREGSFGAVPPGWEEPIRILEMKAAELRRLVDDLLLAARLDTGGPPLLLERLDLGKIASRTAELAGGVPELELPGEPVLVKGDRVQLQNLIEHVVGNALAYGREDMPPWVRIEVGVAPEDGVATITIEDRGRGIPAGEEERIFERFTRVEDKTQPTVPGTGLGLYIARELAVRHGGALVLDWTKPGAGSRFLLSIPLT
jgi:signal transduction histidine kinase